jgi:hypothetical protein
MGSSQKKPAVTATSERAESARDRLKGVFLSSLPGLIVAVAAASFQIHSARSTQRYERRAAALREYTLACSQYAEGLHDQSVLMKWGAAYAAAKKTLGPDAVGDGAIKVDAAYGVEAENKRAFERNAQLRATALTASALFGIEVEPFAGLPPLDFSPSQFIGRPAEDLGAELEAKWRRVREMYEGVAKNCGETTAKLAARLDE